MALSRRKGMYKRRKEQKGARATEMKSISDDPNPDGITDATEKFGESSVTVQNDLRTENSCNISQGKPKTSNDETDVPRPGLDVTYYQRIPTLIPYFHGETSNSKPIILSDNNTENMTCKPCSVVLERLCENQLKYLSPRKDIEHGKLKKKGLRKIYYNYARYRRERRRHRLNQTNNQNSRKLDTVFEKGREKKKNGQFENSSEHDDEYDKTNSDKKISQLPASLSRTKLKCRNSSTHHTSNGQPSKSIGVIFENSGHKSSSKRFSLPLERRISNTKGTRRNITTTEDENQDGELNSGKSVNSTLKSKRKRLSLERNLIDAENNETVAPKRRKYKKSNNAKIEDCERLIASGSTADDPGLGQQFDDPDVLNGQEVLNDQYFDEGTNSNMNNETPIKKAVRISLRELSHSPDSPGREQKVNFEPLDGYTNTCARVRTYQRKTPKILPIKVNANKLNKCRGTKITDYFRAIVKKNMLSENDATASDQVKSDLTLKKKYGICKEAVVLLVNLNKPKLNLSEYVASEIGKLTNLDIKLSPTLNIPTTRERMLPLKNTNSLQYDNESSIMEEQSSAGVADFSLADQNAAEQIKDLLHACKSPIANNESLGVAECTPIKCRENLLIESSVIECGVLKSGNKRGSLNREVRVKYRCYVRKNLYGTGTNFDKDSVPLSRTKYLSESDPTLHSLFSDDNESSNCSLVSGAKNDMPETLNRSNRLKRNLSLSPRKCGNWVTSEMKTNESQLCKTKVSTESNEVRGQSSDEVGKIKKDTSVVDKDSTISPILTSVTKSSLEIEKLKSQSQQKFNSRLPLNTMTCLNFGVINENGSCLGLGSTINDVTGIGGAENKQTITRMDNNKKVPRTTTVTKNVDNNLLEGGNNISTVLSTELKNKKADLGKSLKTSDKPVRLNIKVRTREDHNASVIEQEVKSGQLIDLAPGRKVSTSDLLARDKKSRENNDKPIPVLYINEDLRRSNSSEQEQGDLVMDVTETDVDTAAEVENVISDKLSAGSTSAGATVEVNEACKNSEATSKKECIMCKTRFGRIADLEEHLQVHIKDTSSCILCDKTLTEENAVKHYLGHCSCVEEDESGFHACDICNRKFRKLSGIKHHLKWKHKVNKKRFKSMPSYIQSNQCTICQIHFTSKYDLFGHVFSHTDHELQTAYEVAKISRQLQPVGTPSEAEAPAPQDKPSNTPRKEKPKDPEKPRPKPAATSEIPATPPAATPANCAVSICICHKDERLRISGSVIIEVALTCRQCKIFFKTRRCFKNHFTNTSCNWSENSTALPAMFCNKCCVILNSLQEMHAHLKHHTKTTSKTKSSFLCKLCNVYFFGTGSLFYGHWFNHCNNPLFVADHSSFPNNFKVKIVEPEPTQAPHNIDEPTENLFVAEHQCHSCQEPFETEEDLKKHFNSSDSCLKKFNSKYKKTENPKALFKIICSICNKAFDDKPSFDRHVKDHDAIITFLEVPKFLIKSSKIDQRYCGVCKTEYKSAKLYRAHFIRHVIIREKFICNCCSLMVDSVDKFERHIAEHKGTLAKPVACKVIFATSKFHCKPCKIWFDNQTTLDEHLLMHNKQAPPNQTSVVSSPLKSASGANEKKNLVSVTSDQQCNHQVDVIGRASTENKDASNKLAKKKITVLQISDDSNSSEVGIIKSDELAEQRKESTVRNPSVQGEKQAPSSSMKNKPIFLRVKNLKELLPYSCSTCKMEFDTQKKLSDHICNNHETQAQDPNFKYTCTICNNYKCNNDADWNLHTLSHFPLSSSPRFSNSWFNVLSSQSNKPILKCNVCAKYGCISVSMMRDHFINVHPDIYRPVYNCRVCRSFKTTVEQDIRRHEAAHFQKSSATPPALVTMETESTSLQSVENRKTVQDTATEQPADKTNHNQPPTQPEQNPASNFQRSDSIQSIVELTNNVPQFQQGHNDPSNFQQANLVSPVTRLENNSSILQPVSSSLQPVKNVNNIQQPVAVALTINPTKDALRFTSGNNTNGYRQIDAIAATNNSSNNLSSVQPIASTQWIATTMQAFENPMPINNNSPFTNASYIINTVPSHAVTNPVYSCGICKNFRTSSEHQLKTHQALHEYIQVKKPAQLTTYLCKDCPNFSCNTQEQLATHFKTFHTPKRAIHVPPIRAKPTISQLRAIFKCNHCPQTFGSSADLGQHVYKSHTYFIVNQQPNPIQPSDMYTYACPLCSIRFSDETYIHAHLRDAHPNDNVTTQKAVHVQNLFRCDVCKLYLVSQDSLNCHMTRSHNMILQ